MPRKFTFKPLKTKSSYSLRTQKIKSSYSFFHLTSEPDVYIWHIDDVTTWEISSLTALSNTDSSDENCPTPRITATPSHFISNTEAFVLPHLKKLGDGGENCQISVDEADAIIQTDMLLNPTLRDEALADEIAAEDAAMETAGVSGTFHIVYEDFKQKLRKQRRDPRPNQTSTKYMQCATVCAAMRRRFPEEQNQIGKVIKATFKR